MTVKGKGGRTKDVPGVTPAQLEQATKALQLGLTVRDACVLGGMSTQTFYKWLAIGKTKPAGDPLRAFADAVAQGKMLAKRSAIAAVHKGFLKDWKAGAWYLGVSYPKEYGPKVKVTLDTEFEAALSRLEKALPPDMYEKALDAIAGGEGEGPDSGPPPEGPGPDFQ